MDFHDAEKAMRLYLAMLGLGIGAAAFVVGALIF